MPNLGCGSVLHKCVMLGISRMAPRVQVVFVMLRDGILAIRNILFDLCCASGLHYCKCALLPIHLVQKYVYSLADRSEEMGFYLP